MDLSGLECQFISLLVHISKHEDVVSFVIDGDDGNESVLFGEIGFLHVSSFDFIRGNYYKA
jgi:hypothetical protein